MKKLYVGNLSFQATEEELRAEFENAGIETESVTVVRDRDSGQSRGFGFAEIRQDGDMERAITSLNGRDVMGRAIVVNEARPKPSTGGNGRGGFSRDHSARRFSGGGRRRDW